MSIPHIISMTLVVLFSAFHSGQAIKCYRCLPKQTPAMNNQSAIEACGAFDYSSKYIIDCPHSTFCMKRNFTLEFPGGRSAIVTERGCAHQSLSYRVLKKGTWHTVNDVNETLYEDGCQLEGEQPDAFSHKPPTLYCYCSGRLCNTAGTSGKFSLSLLFLAVFIPLSL